jgi:Lrp/AsnC family transcriptional regulator
MSRWKMLPSRACGNRRDKIRLTALSKPITREFFPAAARMRGEWTMDDLDRRILAVLQEDATLPVEKIAARVNASKSPVWARIRKLREAGVIDRQVAIVNPAAVRRDEVFFVMIKTGSHSADWLERFAAAVSGMGEIQEAHRLAGEIDYLLKVRVRDTRAFDAFYKRLVAEVELFSVTSSLSMETLKEMTAIPLDDA